MSWTAELQKSSLKHIICLGNKTWSWHSSSLVLLNFRSNWFINSTDDCHIYGCHFVTTCHMWMPSMVRIMFFVALGCCELKILQCCSSDTIYWSITTYLTFLTSFNIMPFFYFLHWPDHCEKWLLCMLHASVWMHQWYCVPAELSNQWSYHMLTFRAFYSNSKSDWCISSIEITNIYFGKNFGN